MRGIDVQTGTSDEYISKKRIGIIQVFVKKYGKNWDYADAGDCQAGT